MTFSTFSYLLANTADLYTPDRPSCPHIVSIIGQSVYLEWTAPENDGGSALTGYVLMYGAPDAPRSLYSRETVTGQTTNCTLTNKLYPGRTYQFAVAAKNNRGTGDFSDIASTVAVSSDSGAFVSMHFHVLFTIFSLLSNVSE